MVLKIWSLVIVSLLVMLHLGVVSGADLSFKSFYAPYYPDNINHKEPNLFIGGILQKSPNADRTDSKWRDFADNNKAIFVPTYYSLLDANLVAVNLAAQSGRQVDGSTIFGATDENGLTRNELNGKKYNTIIAYSGGTTTVVTAMADQNVEAKTLILISPIMGGALGDTFDYKGEFEKRLQKIISKGTKIIVIQSPDDTLPLGDESLIAAGYQYRFPVSNIPADSWLSEIAVHNVELGKSGVGGHQDIFDTYAMENIKSGRYLPPMSSIPESNIFQQLFQKLAEIAKSLLSPLITHTASDPDDVIGKWDLHLKVENWKSSYKSRTLDNTNEIRDSIIDIHSDGTINDSFQDQTLTGEWNKYGDKIRINISVPDLDNNPSQLAFFEGRIDGEIMSGTGSLSMPETTGSLDIYFSWSANRVGAKESGVPGLNAEFWVQKGRDLFNQSRYDESINCFDEAIKLDQTFIDAWIRKSKSIAVQDKPDEAIQCLDEALKVNPQSEKLQVAKGAILFLVSRYDEAIQCFDEAITLNQSSFEAWGFKGHVLFAQGKYDEAIQDVDEGLSINPQSLGLWELKGMTLDAQGKYDEAIQCYDEAIRIDPQEGEIWLNKGNVYMDQGNYDEAIQCYEEAIRIDPQEAIYWKNKGEALQILGRNTEANEALIKSGELGGIKGQTIGYGQGRIQVPKLTDLTAEDSSKGQSTQAAETTQDTSVASSSSDISANSDVSETNTKTAYTKDGTIFISKERMEQNIKYGWAKPEDYSEVQVPLDTVVSEPSPES